MHVILREDGTIGGEMYGEPLSGLWFAEGETVTFSLNGDTESGGMEGELLVLRGGGSSVSFSRSAAGGATPAAEPADLGSIGLRADVKYVTVSITVTASGAVLGPDSMPEYAITFHTNGTADFVMSGVPVEGLPWTAAETGIKLDYFGQEIGFTPENGGVTMNFFGSMLMEMMPQE